MYFLSILLKITNVITSIFITSFKPYVISKIGQYNIAIPNYTKDGYILEHKVYLSYPNGVRIDITQPPGTKYPYLPSDFQADSYIIVNEKDGKETFIRDNIFVNNNIVKKRRPIID